MKEKMIYIETSDSRYPIIFDLNVLYEIQEMFGSFVKWSDTFKEVGWECVLQTTMIFVNEGIDYENELTGESREFITEKQAGRIITEVGIQKVIHVIGDSVVKYNKSKNVMTT